MPTSDESLLIVNADDLGWEPTMTDLTIEAFGAGRISSATWLAHMADSERAAEVARDHGLPTGLHLNLTDPYTGNDVPATDRDRHRDLCRHFAMGRTLHLRSWTYDPRIQGEVEWALATQLERYHALFGGPPTHVDGHNHVHVCPNVARARSLRGLKRRNAIYAWPATRTTMGLARAVRRAVTNPRELTTSYLFDIARLDRRPERLQTELGHARRTSVEVMAHPGFDHEHEALSSDSWRRTIGALPLGSYADLH